MGPENPFRGSNKRLPARRARYPHEWEPGRVGNEVHRRSGKDLPLHRPRRQVDFETLAELRRRGLSFRAIAKHLEIESRTARRAGGMTRHHSLAESLTTACQEVAVCVLTSTAEENGAVRRRIVAYDALAPQAAPCAPAFAHMVDHLPALLMVLLVSLARRNLPASFLPLMGRQPVHRDGQNHRGSTRTSVWLGADNTVTERRRHRARYEDAAQPLQRGNGAGVWGSRCSGRLVGKCG